jgi:predicted RecA/RadA family phage recombinase
MAASTRAREASRKPGELQGYLMGAVKINKGTFVFVRVADGYAYPGRSAANITDLFVGVAFETIDNSAGSAGGATIMVEKSGSFVFPLAGAVQTQVGTPVYASDDQTLTASSGSTVIKVGVIQQIIDSADVRIRINGAIN